MPEIGVGSERETDMMICHGFRKTCGVLLGSRVSFCFECTTRVYGANKCITPDFRLDLDLSCLRLIDIVLADVALPAVGLYAGIAEYHVVLASPADATSMCRKENVS